MVVIIQRFKKKITQIIHRYTGVCFNLLLKYIIYYSLINFWIYVKKQKRL